mgnify:CR=1 FL=1
MTRESKNKKSKGKKRFSKKRGGAEPNPGLTNQTQDAAIAVVETIPKGLQTAADLTKKAFDAADNLGTAALQTTEKIGTDAFDATKHLTGVVETTTNIMGNVTNTVAAPFDLTGQMAKRLRVQQEAKTDAYEKAKKETTDKRTEAEKKKEEAEIMKKNARYQKRLDDSKYKLTKTNQKTEIKDMKEDTKHTGKMNVLKRKHDEMITKDASNEKQRKIQNRSVEIFDNKIAEQYERILKANNDYIIPDITKFNDMVNKLRTNKLRSQWWWSNPWNRDTYAYTALQELKRNYNEFEWDRLLMEANMEAKKVIDTSSGGRKTKHRNRKNKRKTNRRRNRKYYRRR